MPPRRYYPALDGLRGVAALAVTAYHAFQYSGLHVFDRGYLAVDFFFMLSGFVIAAAYLDRDITPATFAVQRAVRLYPTILLAAGVSALCFGSTYPAYVYLAQAFIVPLPSHVTAYPADYALWSMFSEVAINAVFIGCLTRRTGRRALALAAVGLAVLLIGMHGHHSVNFGTDTSTFLIGLARVTVFFPIGVVIFLLHQEAAFPSLSLPWSTVALLTVLALPHVARADMLVDLALVLVALPCCLALSIGTGMSERLAAMCRRLGLLSYPLYLVHVPIVLACERSWGTASSARVGAVLAALAAGVVVTWGYDVPVRAWLARALRQRAHVPVHAR